MVASNAMESARRSQYRQRNTDGTCGYTNYQPCRRKNCRDKDKKCDSFRSYRVRKCSYRRNGSAAMHSEASLDPERDSLTCLDRWYRDLFGMGHSYWTLDLLQLAEKYIKYMLRADNGQLKLKGPMSDCIASLVLQCGFRSKLKHPNSDINNIVRVQRVPRKVHSALMLDSRYGFSVFDGICFNGHLAHPGMECLLARSKILQVRSMSFRFNEGNAPRYEEMEDVCESMESIDPIIDHLRRGGVKLIHCSNRVPLYIAKKLYMAGITCIMNVDPNILEQVSIALGRSILEYLDEGCAYSDYIGTIEKFRLINIGQEGIVALSLEQGFHGCSILYSKRALTVINEDNMKNMLMVALFRFQGLYEELNLVKNLGGRMQAGTCMSPQLNTLDKLRSLPTVLPDSLKYHNLATKTNTQSFLPSANRKMRSHLQYCKYWVKKDSPVNQRRLHRKRQRRAADLFKRSNNLEANKPMDKEHPKGNMYFSDWLIIYLTGAADLAALSSSSAVTIYSDLQQRSALEFLQYYTKDSEICGMARRQRVPIGTYRAGLFLSDFLSTYKSNLQTNKCMSSAGCSAQLSMHHLHLETTFDPPSMIPKRATLVVEASSDVIRNSDFTYMLTVTCKVCANSITTALDDMTFGRFLHMLIYDRCYTSQCGHRLFANHRFTLQHDDFAIYIRVQDISNYKVGAWFTDPLFNCDLGSLPLFSAGNSVWDRKLLQISNTLQKLQATCSESVETYLGVRSLLSRSNMNLNGHTISWDPYDGQELDLLHLKDRSSIMAQSLRNLFKMMMAFTKQLFPELIQSEAIEEVLHCRCRFSNRDHKGRNKIERNYWFRPVSLLSILKFQQEYEDRCAFGLCLHPTLLDRLANAISEAEPFGICKLCNENKFSSVAEFEVLNWVYIITTAVRNIGSRLLSLCIALEEYSIVEHKQLRRNVSSEHGNNGQCSVGEVNTSSDAIETSNDDASQTKDDTQPSMDQKDAGDTVPLDMADRRKTNGGTETSKEAPIAHMVSRINTTMEDIRLTYIQCISHFMFTLFWTTVDPMHLFMTVRCFFVSLTNICRGLTNELKTHNHGNLSNLRVIDNGDNWPSKETRASFVTSDHEASASEGELNTYESVTSEESPREMVDTTDVDFRSAGSSSKNESSNDPLHKLAPNLTLGECRAQSLRRSTSSMFDRKPNKGHESSIQCEANSAGDPKEAYETRKRWYSAWGCMLKVDRILLTSTGLHKGTMDGNVLHNTEGSNSSTMDSIPMFIQKIFSSGLSFAFVDTIPGASNGSDAAHRYISRMRKGCSGNTESIVAVDYDVLYQKVRDVGNIIARAFMSPEYLHLCQANFNMPLKGNICHMAKSLLNHCKNNRYCLMVNLSSGTVSNDEGAIHMIPSHATKEHRPVGIHSYELLFRDLGSSCSSLFLSRSRWKTSVDQEQLQGHLIKLQEPVELHGKLVDNPLLGMAPNDAAVANLNLFCHWKDIRANLERKEEGPQANSSRVLCPITKPCLGTPVVICNSRLLNHAWCEPTQDGNNAILDSQAKKLFMTIKNDYQVLSRLIEASCKNLMEIYIESTSTHAIVACASHCTDRLFDDHSRRPERERKVTCSYRRAKSDSFLDVYSDIRRNNHVGYSTKLGSRHIQVGPIGTGISHLHKAKDRRQLAQVPEDVKGCESISLQNVHKSYVITLHYPEALHILRHMSCGDDISFARSLCRSSRLRHSGGKSGAPLFVSHDGKYVLKLLNRYEFQLFLDKGHRFFQHVMGGGTLLSIPYGLFSIEHKRTGAVVRCLVMQNIDHSFHHASLTFDLKGISHKRYVNLQGLKIPESLNYSYANPNRGDEVTPNSEAPEDVVLLDRNFKEYTNGCPLRLDETHLNQLFEFIARDLDFLKTLDVVDYSLLLRLCPEEGVILLGIIDYLRPYTWDKQIETIGKKLANIASGKAPTIVSPIEYRARFMAFFKRSLSLPILKEADKEPVEHPQEPEGVFNAGPVKIQTTTAPLYNSAHVTSLHHHMRAGCPTALRYIQRLSSRCQHSETPLESSVTIAQILHKIYDVPAIGHTYRRI